jgi:hypothetical protein
MVVQRWEGSDVSDLAVASRRFSRAAIHEAAHEVVALAYGCRDVQTFVHSAESGICYHLLPPLTRWDDTSGGWLADDLGRVRARAAVAMSGGMAECIYDERLIPGYEELLIGEGADPTFDEFCFAYGSLEEVFNHAATVFSDNGRGADWLKTALPGVYANTRTILEENWSHVLRRARELDQTLQAAA